MDTLHKLEVLKDTYSGIELDQILGKLTHPHYIHEGAEANVLPHGPIGAEEVLAIIAAEVAD